MPRRIRRIFGTAMDKGYEAIVRKTIDSLLSDIPEPERGRVRESLKGHGVRKALDIVAEAAMPYYKEPEWLKEKTDG